MSTNVCVVTSVEMGWDCVVGVWKDKEAAIKQLTEDWGEEIDESDSYPLVFHSETMDLD